MRRTIADQRGFTLVELLVASALAAIGFLGLAATHMTALRATVTGRHTSTAAFLGAEQMEILRRLPYDEIVGGEAQSVTVEGRTYARQVGVADSPVGTSKRVVVTTTWSDRFGGHQAQLVSVIAP